jgi:hypothetical protein
MVIVTPSHSHAIRVIPRCSSPRIERSSSEQSVPVHRVRFERPVSKEHSHDKNLVVFGVANSFKKGASSKSDEASGDRV